MCFFIKGDVNISCNIWEIARKFYCNLLMSSRRWRRSSLGLKNAAWFGLNLEFMLKGFDKMFSSWPGPFLAHPVDAPWQGWSIYLFIPSPSFFKFEPILGLNKGGKNFEYTKPWNIESDFTVDEVCVWNVANQCKKVIDNIGIIIRTRYNCAGCQMP